MEVNQKSGTTAPQTEPDMLVCNSHIWITEKSRFIYRTLVQGVDFLNAMSYYLLSYSDQKYHIFYSKLFFIEQKWLTFFIFQKVNLNEFDILILIIMIINFIMQ